MLNNIIYKKLYNNNAMVLLLLLLQQISLNCPLTCEGKLKILNYIKTLFRQ